MNPNRIVHAWSNWLFSRIKFYYNLSILALRILKNEGVVCLWWNLMHFLTKKKRTSSLDYSRYIQENEPSVEDLTAQRNRSFQYSYRPLISIIIPVYNPPIDILEKTLHSVISQSYDNWEICIVDGNSDEKIIRDLLQSYAERFPNIHVRFLTENLGISENTNNAVQMAQGEFIALLDHDDLISPHALFEIVHHLNDNPLADIVYTDEDKIDDHGNRFDPFFKPKFSPELLNGMNYLIHFTIIRKSLFDTVQGFKKAFDGAQDYDLFFRCIENGANISHIPKVLYHWRILDSSSSQSTAIKPWIYEIGKKAVQDHLDRCNIRATVKTGGGVSLNKIQYVIDGTPPVDILIPTRRLSQFKKCLNALKKTRYRNYSIHAIINGIDEYQVLTITSPDGRELIPFTDGRTDIIGPSLPYNWSKMNNIALKQTFSPYVVTLNDDVYLKTDDWIEQFLMYAQMNHVGSVGCLLLNPDGSIQHAGTYITDDGMGDHCFKGFDPHSLDLNGILQIPRECSGVTSACMMVRREFFDKNGYFDEKLRNYDDFEFSIRLLKNGYSHIFTPYVWGYHDESQTRPLIINPDMINYLKDKTMPIKELYYRHEWEMMIKRKQENDIHL